MARQAVGVQGRRAAARGTHCPWCGQTLANRKAVEHLLRAEKQLRKTIKSEEAVRAQEAASKRVEAALRKLAAKEDELAALKRRQREQLRALRDQVKGEARAEVDKELRSLQRQVTRLREELESKERQLERLNVSDRGDMSEQDLFEALRHAFREDEIARRKRGQKGTDIMQQVWYRAGKEHQQAGLIIWECKDTNKWNNAFLAQASTQRETHGTTHVVVVSRVLPPRETQLFVRDGIIVARPREVLPVAHILRSMVIGIHRAGLSADAQAWKTRALHRYLASEEFRGDVTYMARRTETLSQLLVHERDRHKKDWTKREQHYSEIAGKIVDVDQRIRGIIEETKTLRPRRLVALAAPKARRG